MTYTREIAELARAERKAKADIEDENYVGNAAGRREAEQRLGAAQKALQAAVKASMPDESVMCLALIRPGSNLAREWKLEKPAYCIYEYDRGFGKREIRWGDGSWQSIDEEDHADLILLPQFGDREISDLFD